MEIIKITAEQSVNNNNKTASVSGDNGEPSFLFQRISITIQRFNSILLYNSFSSDEE